MVPTPSSLPGQVFIASQLLAYSCAIRLFISVHVMSPILSIVHKVKLLGTRSTAIGLWVAGCTSQQMHSMRQYL